jgi:hypothetical protein
MTSRGGENVQLKLATTKVKSTEARTTRSGSQIKRVVVAVAGSCGEVTREAYSVPAGWGVVAKKVTVRDEPAG